MNIFKPNHWDPGNIEDPTGIIMLPAVQGEQSPVWLQWLPHQAPYEISRASDMLAYVQNISLLFLLLRWDMTTPKGAYMNLQSTSLLFLKDVMDVPEV